MSSIPIPNENNVLETIDDCADACFEKIGCKYFLFGYADKEGKCLWVNTQGPRCPDGVKSDNYSIYEITGLLL